MSVVIRVKTPSKGELLLLLGCLSYVVYYVFAVVRKPRIVCRNGILRRLLTGQMKSVLRSHYWPPFWCTGSVMQRIVASFYHWWLPRVNYRRELFVLWDQGVIALDWLNEDQPGPVVLLIAGGSTDSQSRPWRSMLPMLAKLGFPCVVVNGRGCGGVSLTTHHITYAASVSDFAEVVCEVRKRYPRDCLLGVGVSLGGLVLSLYLCQWGSHAQLDAALAVSPIFQPAVAARTLASPWGGNLLLNACITRGLVGRLRENEEVVRQAKVVRADKVFRCWTLSSFDKHYAAPAFGFRSVQQFYSSCSLKGRLYMVKRPLVFLVSEDDPLNPEWTLPVHEILKSSWLAAVVTPRGGHMSFVDGWLLPRQPFYAERFVAAFALSVHHVCQTRSIRVLRKLGE